MKKTLLLLMVLFVSFTLAACGDKYDINFKESDIVEMTSTEVSTLLSAVDWEAVGEAVKLTIDAEASITSVSSYHLSTMTYSNEMAIDGTFYSETYVVDSETIADVAAHSESQIELSVTQETNANDIITTDETTAMGELNIYFTEGFLYVNPDVQTTSGGTETSISGKEKLNEEVTQAMWDEARSEADVTDVPGMSSVFDVPEEVLNLLNWDSFSGLIDAFPAVTVYQKGTITNVHFEINKTLISDHLEDLLWYVYDEAEAAGEDVGTVAEVTQDIADILTEADTYLDYFDDLSVSIDVIVDNGTLGRVAFEAVVLTNQSFLDEMDSSIDAKVSITADYGVELPKFPGDLDEYEAVDNIGENYNFTGLMSMSLYYL